MATLYRPAADIARDLRAWVDSGTQTQVELAAKVGVTQPQLSRILAGMFTPGRSSAAQKLSKMAGVPMHARSDTASASDRLCATVIRVWDGTPEGVDHLVTILEAVRDFRERRPRRS